MKRATLGAVEADLAHVETELRNIESAIVQGVVGKTTGALLQDREGRRDGLQARLRALTDCPTVSPLRVGPAEIQACLEQLDELLKQDSTRANRVLRQVLEPITMTPVEDGGRRFYRATGAAKGLKCSTAWGWPRRSISVVAGAGFEPATFGL
jgi:hypothetical protein